MTEITITPDIVAEHGLSADEYALVLDILGRTPNITELGIFSVMWSEHCSYKSSKKWLKTLPTEAPWVIQGPGENAGVIDIGDGAAAIFKIESHNHPSFIEPYQGAATGVGGIMRDVFTMGARPIANLNALRFGDPSHPKTRHLVSGVVGGIGGYGNCIGVPTVGGETQFDPAYNGNILVNAMTVGVAPADRIFYSKAAGIGNPVVYVGSKTGRDGIHGATMASAEFDDDSEEKRPTVQVGDPFTEKLLLEACLELMATDAIIAIQDMGAAGLTSSSVEMSSKGNVGIVLDLDKVPVRETGMSAYEIMLSESQERMLMVLKPGREDDARAIFEKWELDFAVIGTVTDSGRLVLRHGGEQVCDIPVDPLVSLAPEYDRPWDPTPAPAVADSPAVAAQAVAALGENDAILLRMMGSEHLASRRWIWEQYDYLIRGETRQPPGGDAAVVTLNGASETANGGGKALAMTTDCTPRYCLADPRQGGMQAVAEAYRNLSATGATPRAVTNNLNFGNPERPAIMGQIVGCVQGMGDACRELDFPVISGNVSLYNETNGQAILPTPVIGGVGVLAQTAQSASIAVDVAGLDLILIGDTDGWLGASLLQVLMAGTGGTVTTDGAIHAPPPVHLAAEKAHGTLVRALIADGLVAACHDLSDGGLAVAAAEMALAGTVGMTLLAPQNGLHQTAWFFGEDQGRYLLATADAATVLERAAAAKVPATRVGQTIAARTLTLADARPISLADLSACHENWLPDYMETTAAEATA